MLVSSRHFFPSLNPTVRRQFHHRTPPLPTIVSLAALLLLLTILLASANFSIHGSPAHAQHRRLKPFQRTHQSFLQVEQELGGWQSKHAIDPHCLLPPLNVSADERMSWFRRNLPTFKIIHPGRSSRRFAKAASEFFSIGCEIRFFMTWISSTESFGQRELFSLESLFKQHPFACLLILSRSMDSGRGRRILKPLSARGYRVMALAPDLQFLFNGTPAELWFKELRKGNVDPGEIPLAQNLSNLLRIAVLYKFGGVYVDTDVIILRSFSSLRNSIGAQSMIAETGEWRRLNNAVLVFDKNHPLLFKFIQEFSLTFDGTKWGHNGPYLVSRVASRVAGRPGFNFTILPPMAFYPVDWSRIGGYFRQPATPAASRWVEAKLVHLHQETYAIHLWNRQSNRIAIENGSIIHRLISDHCIFCEY
ncbi:uncharacterized protein LOC116254064 [Nymphaea colorata]|nr:uncharacterized protein LOC116254064 [Nymphaea colorata]